MHLQGKHPVPMNLHDVVLLIFNWIVTVQAEHDHKCAQTMYSYGLPQHEHEKPLLQIQTLPWFMENNTLEVCLL